MVDPGERKLAAPMNPLFQTGICTVPITPGRIEGYRRRGESLTVDYLMVYRNTKLAALDELKKSLLHQAFTGEL